MLERKRKQLPREGPLSKRPEEEVAKLLKTYSEHMGDLAKATFPISDSEFRRFWAKVQQKNKQRNRDR